jgi:hypothetical protein
MACGLASRTNLGLALRGCCGSISGHEVWLASVFQVFIGQFPWWEILTQPQGGLTFAISQSTLVDMRCEGLSH